MAPKGEPTQRKTPRRLFSFDSLKSSSTQGSSSEASSIDADTSSSRRHFRAPSQPTLLEQVDESPQERRGWSIYGGSQSNTRSESPNPDKTRSASRLDLRRPLPLAMDKTSISDAGVPRSPSLMRWDHLRQHVVPDATPTVSSHSQQPSSASSSAFSLAPSRVQTPKPSRLAQHLGFRQVVEHAREMVIDDTRKLSQELLRACWAARSADATTKPSKADQYLQFMPAPSVATTAASTTAPKPDLRRPSSIQSLALAARAPAVPSLKPLYQLLLHHSLPSADAIMPVPVLPQEPQVLSTLLFPFLNPDKAVRVDEDRWFAFEAFDIIIKTWKPPNETTAMERCKWCCKAALIPYSPLRPRILRALRSMLSPAELAYRATTPSSIQMLATGLFCLLPTISGSGEEHTILGEAIVLLLAGDYGALDVVAVQEQFNALFAAQDTHEAVRQALVLDALARCLENGAESTRRWLLENALEEYWPRQPEKASFTPLLAAVQACKLVAFTRMALLGLRSKPRHPRHTQFVVHFTQTRVLPELAAMHAMTSVALEARRNVVEIALELLVPETPRELGLWAMTLLSQWYREVQGEWKTSIDGAVQRIILERAWPAVLNVLSALLSSIPDDVRKPLCGVLLPSLADRLVDDPPPHPCLPLTDFLEQVSQLYPPVFYKPLFSCAASNKEVAVLNHLSAITAVARFLPDYWTRNAEMTSVALMSGGSTKATVQSPDALPTWGTARLGQSVLLLELIGRIQAVRRGKEGSSTPDNMYVDIIKFVHALETRLSVLIDVKERTSLVPLSQRMLFMMLFREIRLLIKSLKPAGWLPRMVSWFVESHEETQLNDDSDLELIDAVAQIQGLYTTARDNIGTSRQKKRGTVIMSAAYDGAFNLNSANDTKGGISSVFAEKEQLVLSLAKGFRHKALKLLVAMSTLLTVDDFLRIGPLVWEHHLGGIDPSVVSAASFLVMQCAEKTPHEMEVLMEVDIRSSDDTTRLDAVRRINTLANWRFQIMSQQVIVDRNHRAFKLARGPLAFVATDIGTGQFVRGDDLGDSKDSVPLELRKRLVEIGWVQDEAPVDQHLEWIKTPISNLPVLYLDRLELPGNEQMMASATASPSPAASPNPSHKGSPSLSSSAEKNDEITLLRRNSSSGGPLYGVKRRAIFVSSLALIFPRLATTVFDPNFLIAATARSTIIDLMRNDPALLTRPVLDLFAGPHKNMTTAISTFRAFLHVRRVLPPPLTHHVFNSLTGFLKSHVKSSAGGDDTLYDFALTIPILAKLVTQVSGMSMREIRRAKVEAFLIPSGSLWFPPTAPTGPMFPRHIGQLPASLDDIPSHLVHVSMIRLSQNMLFLAMLKRNPQDVQMIRKSMTRLVLPSLQQLPDAPVVEMKDFAPARAKNVNFHPSYLDVNVTNLSMIVSRSYLLLIAQIFRSMSRHLSDRSELGVLIDGLNRILLAHGSDIGIVAHALIALMVASTRFTRLFTSGGGYTLFVPVLIKVYTESEMHNGIRLAIEYAFNRFYALHREAFVFQSVDSMAVVMSLPDIDGPWVAKNVHALFATLTRGISPSTPDAAAISGANKLQEKEALMFSTADEKPQTFLASLKKGGAQDKIKVIVDLPEEYETKRLGLDNLVRLFLTVIAHDPTVMRAQQFLRFLRYIAPILYHASTSSRSVLKEGIDALGVILMRPSAKSKGADANDHLEEPSMESLFAAFPEGQQPNKTKIPSDLLVMRMDYLLLVVNFTRVGGQLSPPASRRAIELVKLMLRDHGNETSVSVSSFVANYTKNSLIRDSANAPTSKAVIGFLADLSPVISSYAMTLDFSGVFDTVAQLCKEPIYANEPLFSRVVVAQICAPALVACEQAASEKLLFSLSSRLALVSLVAQAITLQGADVIAEVERRKPSYEYLAGFILPLALILKTEGQTTSSEVRAEPWHREAHRNTWVRLLAYAMTACRQQVDPNTRDRSKSPDRHRSSTALSKSPVTIFVTALQVIKVVIIRGQEVLSACLPGIWSRVALFLKTALEEGSAKFALRAARDLSPSSSPYGSPRSSSQFEHLQPIPNQLSAYFTSSAPGQLLLSPRIVDYTLWSFLELLCAFRSPLTLQMRLFIQAKVVSLSQEIRQYNGTASPSRRVSTAFSKPRRRSMIPSPEASPGLSPTHSFVNISHASVLSLDTSVGRQAGYYQPSSPHDVRGAGRIVHLGPIAQPEHRSGSPAGGRIRLMAKSTKVRSLVLIQATYRRIRLVQTAMGYDSALLPGAQMPGEDAVPTWTQAQALDAVVQETKELMEEFEQAFWSAANDLVVVDPDQSMSTSYGD
ncbi:hypothetical protein GGX14DRAFT_473423 [Mycena pura]|uniref:Uncharacterized protein n=1 Tax=Mycena pura TaxID=153505 RepID=A0AAD6Y4R9_9AGAR|nr:hypothetical protein GGX14DRAFT_473423 [Mycena pura]